MSAPDRPTRPVELVRNVRIPMPDGVTLAADLHRPVGAAGERFPAIIEYTPYHKANNFVYGPRASRYPYFASRGYVFVNVDIRGTGDSEGFNTAPTSPEEVADNLEVIRWCARQPWCDGSVGMIGISYTAGVCYDAARRAPPELKAIVLCQMCSDWYDGVVCPGGSPRPFIWENFAPLMAAYNFAPPDPDRLGPAWADVWQQRLEGSVPWGNAYAANLRDGPFWEGRLLRGDAEKVRAATFLIGGWCDYYPDDMLRVFSQLRCPKRALMGPWTHNYPENAWPLPRLSDRYECLRWFDRHLKTLDTDPARPVDREPPVVVFVREFTRPAALRREENGRFRSEPGWPPQGQERVLNLSPDARLLANEAPAAGRSDLCYRPDVGIAAGRYAIGQMLPGWGMGDDQRLDEALSLTFTADPVTDPDGLEIVGCPVARLRVSSTAGVAFLSAKLCDVAPDGTSVLVTKSVLNLTNRDSRENPELLVQDGVYAVELPLQAIAYRFRPGHRPRLMVAAADFQNQWPTPTPYTLTVHHDPKRPSQLVLPVAGPATLPEPVFQPSEFPPLPPDQIPTPDYRVTRDFVREAVTVEIRTLSGVGVNRSEFTVNLARPAEAVVRSEFELKQDRPGQLIVVRSQCVTRSDATTFHHLTDVEITVNGRPHWSKGWAVSVPRELW